MGWQVRLPSSWLHSSADRASDYGSEGRRFESSWGHATTKYASLAQWKSSRFLFDVRRFDPGRGHGRNSRQLCTDWRGVGAIPLRGRYLVVSEREGTSRNALVAQRKSSGLRNRVSGVRIPPGAQWVSGCHHVPQNFNDRRIAVCARSTPYWYSVTATRLPLEQLFLVRIQVPVRDTLIL